MGILLDFDFVLNLVRIAGERVGEFDLNRRNWEGGEIASLWERR